MSLKDKWKFHSGDFVFKPKPVKDKKVKKEKPEKSIGVKK